MPKDYHEDQVLSLYFTTFNSCFKFVWRTESPSRSRCPNRIQSQRIHFHPAGKLGMGGIGVADAQGGTEGAGHQNEGEGGSGLLSFRSRQRRGNASKRGTVASAI